MTKHFREVARKKTEKMRISPTEQNRFTLAIISITMYGHLQKVLSLPTQDKSCPTMVFSNQTDENVAFGFNKQIITTLLRDSLNFKGVICTDWNIINNTGLDEARAWGVEHLSPKERVLKVLEAGCDQFGGESSLEQILALVNEGKRVRNASMNLFVVYCAINSL